MNKQDQETKVEVIFHDDLNARNKLVMFIINKVLEDYERLGGLADENKTSYEGGNYRESNERS